MKNFFCVRLLNKQDGAHSYAVTACDTEAEAWKTFFRLCGQAVDSEHLTDSVSILNKEGFEIDHRVFTHKPSEVEGE